MSSRAGLGLPRFPESRGTLGRGCRRGESDDWKVRLELSPAEVHSFSHSVNTNWAPTVYHHGAGPCSTNVIHEVPPALRLHNMSPQNIGA